MSGYKIVGIIAIIWNLIGAAMYVMGTQVTPELLIESYGETGGAILGARPAWATSAVAIATFAGLIGSIGLLMGKSWSKILFIVSLLGLIAHTFWAFSSKLMDYAPTAEKGMMAIVFLIALFLLWFSFAKSKDGTLT